MKNFKCTCGSTINEYDLVATKTYSENRSLSITIDQDEYDYTCPHCGTNVEDMEDIEDQKINQEALAKAWKLLEEKYNKEK